MSKYAQVEKLKIGKWDYVKNFKIFASSDTTKRVKKKKKKQPAGFAFCKSFLL